MTSYCPQKLKTPCMTDTREARETEEYLLPCYPVSIAATSQNPSHFPGLTETMPSYHTGLPWPHLSLCFAWDVPHMSVCLNTWSPTWHVGSESCETVWRLEPCRRKWITRSGPWGSVWPCVPPALFLTTDTTPPARMDGVPLNCKIKT